MTVGGGVGVGVDTDVRVRPDKTMYRPAPHSPTINRRSPHHRCRDSVVVIYILGGGGAASEIGHGNGVMGKICETVI